MSRMTISAGKIMSATTIFRTTMAMLGMTMFEMTLSGKMMFGLMSDPTPGTKGLFGILSDIIISAQKTPHKPWILVTVPPARVSSGRVGCVLMISFVHS